MRQTGYSHVNIEAFVKLFVLLGFALFFFIIIQSGTAHLYVHPRIVPYMKFAIAAMGLISLFVARTVFRPQRKKANLAPYLFFILPLLAAFLLPAKAMDTASISGSNFRAAPIASNSAQDIDSNIEPAQQTPQIDSIPGEETSNDDMEENADLSDDGSTQITPEDAETGDDFGSDSSGNTDAEGYTYSIDLKLKGNTVVVDAENFVMWNAEVFNNLEKYTGKRIEIEGKVLKDKELEANEFAVVRFLMACCAADLQPVGLVCRYDGAEELESDTWIKVTGVIEAKDYQGEKNPVIAVDKVEKAEKPADEYVYW